MSLYEIIYYVYILFFGVYASARLACGCTVKRAWKSMTVLTAALLLAQGAVLKLWGADMVWKVYPLIVHLPIVLFLILALKARWELSLIAVAMAYSLCQPMRWVGLVLDSLRLSPAVSLLLHLCLCQLFFMLLLKFCMDDIHRLMNRSASLRRWMGALPLLYYLYEYGRMYAFDFFADFLLIHELLPTAMVLFFLLFSMIHQREIEKGEAYERQAMMLETEILQASRDIKRLRTIEEKTAIHRHDLRHHLLLINNLLASGKTEQASAYIQEAVGEIEALAPVRYCENELVNLLVRDFQSKAASEGITMTVKADLPPTLPISDTELCVLISNGLENAIHAVADLPKDARRYIDVLVGEKQQHLLIEIINPCAEEIHMQDGLPSPKDGEMRYGCRSIQSIAQRRKGNCLFETADGTFILRVAIPLHKVP